MFFSSYFSEATSSAALPACVNPIRTGRLISCTLALASLFCGHLHGFAAGGTELDKAHLVESYGKMPLSFEPNHGQTSSEVQWVARGPEYALFLSGHDAVLELNSIVPAKGVTDRPKIDSSAVRMNLLGAKAANRTSGEGQQAGTANYFTGNDPSKWQREVPNFERVRLSGVYPGIDLVYYGRQGRLEYDFVVAPGADPSKIALKFDGAEARLAGNGDLILPVAGTAREIRFDKPTVYQMKDGKRQTIAGAFHLASDRTVSFELGSYDRRRELVIDPTLLFAGSIATGNQQTIPTGMVIDSAGAMYLTGYTNDLTFPVTTGALQTNCQTYSAAAAANGFVRCGPSSNTSGFVTKISADGTSLVYSTYLHGGGGYEQGQSIAVDTLGDAYILGQTASNDFPITSDAYQSLCQPYSDGNGGFTAQCDNFYDGGGTEYTVNGPNLFISKLNPQGTALLYSTFFGGSASVYAEGLALDAAGNIYFGSEVNIAESPSNLYPNNGQIAFPTTTTGFQTTGNNLLTPALSKLSADGQTLLYSTFLGSLGANGHHSYNQAFALGKNGVAFLGGYTATADFPTTAGSLKPACTLNTNDSSYCFTTQGFVAAIDTTKSGTASLVYASYLGGEQQQTSNIPEQEVYGLATDASNDLFVTGYTSARDFPSTAGVFQPHCNDVTSDGNCNQTAFLSKINPAGSGFVWSTFFGDTRDGGPGSYGASIAFDSKGQVYLYGLSNDGGQISEVDPISTYTSGNKVFLATFSADATQLKFGTRFSGPSNNAISLAPTGNGLAVDAAGSMYIVGYTGDNGAFGTTTGTYSTTATSGFNRPFFAKISAVTAQSATTLTITPSPAAAGQTITFAASEVGDGSNGAIPTGTVTITVSGVSPTPTVLGTITLDGTGSGRFSTNGLSSGTYSVQAAYSGDSNFEPSQSTVQTLAVTAPITQNLLLNPGAELGSIADWTVGGDGTPQVDTGTFDGGITPHTGSYDFLGYNGALDTLSQTVSIVAQGTGVTAAQVDGGTLTADVSFWEQGLSQGTPSDDGSITLTFLDANGAAIGSPVTTSTVDSHDGTWANGLGTYAIPTGTRSITYTMNFMRNQGSDNDSFIDDNSLSIGTTTGLTLFPQSLHFGNVAVGGQSAPQTVTVTNQQTTTINIVQIMSELGANPKDFVQTNNCPGALTAGASCQVTVTFVPDGVGPKSAGIDLPDDAVPNDQFIRVDGIGTGGILQVNPGNLKTIAGNGTIGNTGDGAPAIMAELNQPNGVAFDPSGNLYIADDVANVVRKVDTAGNITTFAGTGTSGFTGDGGPATQAELSIPFSVASDAAGNIYIQDVGNYVIRKVTASTGIITTFAGTPGVPGHSGDGGPATQARFNNNQGARFDSAGNFYVPTCRGASIRKIDTAGNISTVAGNFTEGYSGDGGQATAAQLQCPSGVAIDTAGNLYIADASNNVIRKVNPQGIISTIAGSTSGVAGSTGDGGPATEALLSLPNDVVLDGVGNLYIADAANNRVRKIDTNGIITTAAGGLDNAGSAAVNTPLGLTTDTAGNVYFSDSGNGKIQEIFPQGTQPFPATQVGTTSAPQNLTLSNIGNVDVTLAPDGAFNLAGNSGDFALTAGGCAGGTVLAASGGSCALSITFTPTAVGQRTLTVQISDNALNSPQAFSIGGMGTPAGGSQATPVITWATPAPITTTTPLSATQLDAVATDANGTAVPGTFVYSPAAGTFLPAGTQTLSVTFMPTDATAFTSATGTTTILVTQGTTGAATTTTLAVSAGGAVVTTVGKGSVVTLTASVSAAQNSITPGRVAFCDASATTCTDNHLLATAQLIGGDTSSTATYKFVPGIGVHSYKAVFLGTTTVAGSVSAAEPLTVTGTYPTTTTIAQSGTAGSYMLSATTVGIGNPLVAPTGTVSFLDSSNSNAVLGTGALGAGTAGLSFAGQSSAANLDAPQTRSVAADFNGDGILDLATANTTAGNPTIYANTVTISLGNGDGTFTTLDTRPTTGNRPQSVVAGDFNGDGRADLAVTNIGDGTVTILLGNGDGSFTAGSTVAVGSNAYGLVTGDFDGNGTLDIAVSNVNGITVLLGDGNGTFAANPISLVSGTTEAFGPIITADFNGDGKADLIVEGYSPTGQLVVLLGNGDGTFATAPAVAMDGQGSNQNNLVAGDFNGDGKVDFAATNSSQNTVLIMTGNGDGTFVTTPAASGTDYYPVDVVAGDFDGDGTLDLGLAYGSFRQRVLLGNGDGTFTTPSITTGVFAFIGVTLGDFNGDGVPDLAGTDGSTNLDIALTQRTQTTVVAATPVAVGAGTHQVVASYPGDATYSASVSSTTSLTGAGAGTPVTPTLTWAMPAPITTATPLSAAQLDAVATDANGVAIQGTFVYTPAAGTLLTAGTQTLSVVFTPTDGVDFTTATATTTIVVTQAVAAGTTTTLAVSSGGVAVTTVAAGSVVTLTATVAAGTTPVSPGQVAFCDAMAASCTDIHLLGTAQLTSAGTATYRFVPGVGSHSYKAEFVGTGNDGASVSSPSVLTVMASFPTTTTIVQSGMAGNYTLTSTTTSTASTDVAPTGMVSFLDTSNGNAVLGTASVGAVTAAITFATPTAPATAFGVPVIADFNGDGVPDIAITQSGTTVGILLGNGDGTFRSGAVITPSQGPAYLAVGDFNNDGKMDFVVASFATRSPQFIAGGVSVFLGNGDGTFNAGGTFAAATTDADYVSVGDFNGDGTLDVAVSDENSNLVTILLGNGDGTFRMGSTNTSGTAPYASVVGDFNGDGKPDIAVTSVYGSSLSVPGNSVIVLLGNGDGTFMVAPSPTVGSTPAGIALGDFNGDGKLDLAVSNEVDGTVSVLLGNGDGTFGTGNTVSTGGNPQPIFSGDFNADGRVDLAVGDMAGNVVDILMGNGDGTFSLQASPATGTEPLFMATGDINGDGLTDIVSANVGMGSNTGSPSNQLTLLLPQVTHTTTASVSAISTLGSGPHQVVASYAGDTSYLASTSAATGLIGITIAPVITWTPAVATIPYGTALGAQQLNATATAAGVAVPGTFVYTPAAGTVLAAGTQTLSVTFTPTSANYSVATGSATITVTQATTVISWAAPAMIPYGTALGAQQLNATATTAVGVAIPGTFVYTPAAGTVLAPGMQTLSVVFTPTDAVDYTTATASVQIVVGGLTLTSFTPVGVLLGSGDTTITLIGTGFVPTSMVMVNGSAVATAYVGPTMLTAVIPAALLRTMGSLAVTVVDPSIRAATVAQTFSVVPPTGGATLTGPTTTDPGTQPTVTLAITNPYPLALTAQFSLAFASAGTTPVDDPSIQFSSGGRTFDFTVAANSTTVPPVELQAGTDAGTITITAKLMADGVDVTPAGLAPLVIVVPAVVPVISGTTITASGKTLTVVMHGFSNTREVSSATFDFTAATGDVLATPSVTIPATTIFGTWYGDPTSVAYGSTFTYTQIFNTSEDAKTIGSVKVTLTNSVGASLVSTSTGP